MQEEHNNREQMMEVWIARAKLFKERDIAVFVKSADGQMLSGKILRFFNDGFDIDDSRKGEYPILYSEIIRLDKRRDQ